jgi:mannitol/fructose-specific phosphotransferase system IIA component (Ntr-type)
MTRVAEATGLLIERDGLLDSLLEREDLCSTALPGGLALLHPRHHDPYTFEDSFVVLGRTVQPIPFGAPDGGKTDLFFLICCQDDRIHLHVLARLSMMCCHTALVADLRACEDADEMYERILSAEREVIAAL